MPSIEEIERDIRALAGTSRLLAFKEIKELPKILWEDERLEQIIQGLYAGGNGILVATNKRLIFVDKGMFYGVRVEDFPYDNITSIQYETGLISGEITVYASGNKAEIKYLDKGRTRDFAEYVRARTTATSKNASSPATTVVPPPLPPADELIARLERLAKLKADGILTEEEFKIQKAKILSS